MSGVMSEKSDQGMPRRSASFFCSGRMLLLPAAEAPLMFMM